MTIGVVALLSACGGGDGDESIPIGTRYWRVVEYRPAPSNVLVCISACTVREFPTIYYSSAACQSSTEIKTAVEAVGNHMECQESTKLS